MERKKIKKRGKNSKKFIVEKEYYEDIVYTDPTTGDLRTQKKVKITRYKLRKSIDPYGPSYIEEDILDRLSELKFKDEEE